MWTFTRSFGDEHFIPSPVREYVKELPVRRASIDVSCN